MQRLATFCFENICMNQNTFINECNLLAKPVGSLLLAMVQIVTILKQICDMVKYISYQIRPVHQHYHHLYMMVFDFHFLSNVIAYCSILCKEIQMHLIHTACIMHLLVSCRFECILILTGNVSLYVFIKPSPSLLYSHALKLQWERFFGHKNSILIKCQ